MMTWDSKIGANGRPADYTDDIGWTIWERLVDGESLRAICADPGMPDKATVLDWLARYPEFRDRYESARAAQAEDLLWETIDVIDGAQGRVEWVRANRKVVMAWDRYELPRCLLRVDVRYWVAARLAPKQFGPNGVGRSEAIAKNINRDPPQPTRPSKPRSEQ
jgi:hypothetical protein